MGWAKLNECEAVSAGTKELASPKALKEAKKQRWDRRLDLRAGAFALWLESQPLIDWIVYEDVKFCSSQAQGHLWGTFRGVVWSFAARRGTNIETLDTGKLKLWTTGHGGATKEMMACAALRRWPDLTVGRNLDDNAIDALCLLQWAREKIQT